LVITNKDASIIVLGLIKTVQVNKDFLSEVDGKIGDGDHGVNMNKGFTMCGEKLRGKTYTLSEGLSTLSSTLLEDIGGSMGPLYGVFFDELATNLNETEEIEEIDEKVFDKMINSALKGIQDIGNAKSGDKTLLDTLIPAKEAFDKALDNNKDFYSCLEDMKIAAKKGWKSTEGMVAKIGRASRLGERSRGVLDAGATSCYLILNSMIESIQHIMKH